MDTDLQRTLDRAGITDLEISIRTVVVEGARRLAGIWEVNEVGRQARPAIIDTALACLQAFKSRPFYAMDATSVMAIISAFGFKGHKLEEITQALNYLVDEKILISYWSREVKLYEVSEVG